VIRDEANAVPDEPASCDDHEDRDQAEERGREGSLAVVPGGDVHADDDGGTGEQAEGQGRCGVGARLLADVVHDADADADEGDDDEGQEAGHVTAEELVVGDLVRDAHARDHDHDDAERQRGASVGVRGTDGRLRSGRSERRACCCRVT
jgi:hypothetical protein